MPMPDAHALWQQLRDRGLVAAAGEPPPLPAGAPWPARLLTAAAAWIATPLLLVFVAMLFSDLAAREAALVPLGLVMCAAVVPLLRGSAPEFMQQAGTVVSAAGMITTAYGLDAGLDLSAGAAAFVLAALAGAQYALSRVWVHRFLCAGVLVAALVWLADSLMHGGMWLMQPLVAAASVALWWAMLRVDPAVLSRTTLSPLAWAVTFAAIGLSWLDRAWHWNAEPGSLQAARWLAALLLPAVAIALVQRADRRRHDLLLVAAAIVLAALWFTAPGVSLALALMLLAFALGSPGLGVVGALSLVAGLVAYYYQLAVPLLEKSAWLGGAGVVLLIVHVALRRTAGARP